MAQMPAPIPTEVKNQKFEKICSLVMEIGSTAAYVKADSNIVEDGYLCKLGARAQQHSEPLTRGCIIPL